MYPISSNTLAKLASRQDGPIYFKPTDKCLYKVQDIESWIEAAVVTPRVAKPVDPPAGRGRAMPRPQPRTKAKAKATATATAAGPAPRSGRKSLPPSPNSWLLRSDD